MSDKKDPKTIDELLQQVIEVAQQIKAMDVPNFAKASVFSGYLHVVVKKKLKAIEEVS